MPMHWIIRPTRLGSRLTSTGNRPRSGTHTGPRPLRRGTAVPVVGLYRIPKLEMGCCQTVGMQPSVYRFAPARILAGAKRSWVAGGPSSHERVLPVPLLDL